MKRRDFIKVTGWRCGRGHHGRAGDRAIDAGTQMADDDELAEIARYAAWRAPRDGQSVGEATDNKFQIQTFAAGEIVPGLQVLDAVQNGTVEMGHTASYYYFGKDPTFTFGSSIRSDPSARLNQAWYMLGGGKEVLNEFYKGYNVTSLLAGNTGCQMGGWFRKEINTVDDLQGLKFRIGGFAGRVLQKLGACRSNSPVATSIPRWKKAPSTRPNGSVPMMTKSSASTRSRRIIIIRGGGSPLFSSTCSRISSSRSC